MHPKVAFPGELEPIVSELASPLHARRLRDARRRALADQEADLSGGWRFDAAAFDGLPHADAALDDLRRFMTVVMDTRETRDGYPLRFLRGSPSGCPAEGAEAHGVRVDRHECVVTARDTDGLRRAAFRLQDEMLRRRAPLLPLGETARWAPVRTRVSRSPVAPYRWLSGWELEDDHDYYPEEYLRKLAHCGVNGIWVAGLLRNLVASKAAPELGPAEHRLEKLRALIAKAAAFGVRVYFFGIEPRALPLTHPALAAHPEMVGARTDIHANLCPSEPLVLRYVREAMRDLFAGAPGLAGFINIIAGERPTTCWWLDEKTAQGCPRCGTRGRASVLAETLDAAMAGIREASAQAELIVWPYTVDGGLQTSPLAPMIEVMERSRADITWMGNFEHGGVKRICGRDVKIREYSLSYAGPSPWFEELAQRARASGRRLCAKLQIGTTYEMSSMPWLPAPGIALDKIARAREAGATVAMLHWIPGGFPSPMLKAACEASFAPSADRRQTLERLAAVSWGEAEAGRVADAWEQFGRAWGEYPFDNPVLYFSPITRAPAYQLHLEQEPRLARPYNFGMERTRALQPWEDQTQRWSGVFALEEVIGAFRSLAGEWEKGLRVLDGVAPDGLQDGQARQMAVARAVRLQCRSAANVMEFFSLRNQILQADAAGRATRIGRMMALAEQEVAATEEMTGLTAVEPAIGYHPETFAFSYSRPMLDERIRQIRDVMETLRLWRVKGVDEAALRRTVEEAERLRPDRWGD